MIINHEISTDGSAAAMGGGHEGSTNTKPSPLNTQDFYPEPPQPFFRRPRLSEQVKQRLERTGEGPLDPVS